MIIQKNGLQCNCGKRGCFEIYASLKRFKEKIAYEFNLTTLRNEEIIKIILNNKDDVRLKYFLNEYVENLAIGISNLINIFEPEITVIGGSFTYYQSILLEPLKEKIIKENDKFEIELQKLLDISSNIENEDLRTRLIAQFIKCQEIILNQN